MLTGPSLVKRTAEFGLLPEDIRHGFCDTVIQRVESGDITAIDDEQTKALFTPTEFEAIKAFVLDDFLENIDSFITSREGDWDDSDDPENHFEGIVNSLLAIEDVVAIDKNARKTIERAIDNIADKVDELREKWNPAGDQWDGDRRYGGRSVSSGSESSMFSDVAD